MSAAATPATASTRAVTNPVRSFPPWQYTSTPPAGAVATARRIVPGRPPPCASIAAHIASTVAAPAIAAADPHLEALWPAPDSRQPWRQVLALLAPRPGERVLDV